MKELNQNGNTMSAASNSDKIKYFPLKKKTLLTSAIQKAIAGGTSGAKNGGNAWQLN